MKKFLGIAKIFFHNKFSELKVVWEIVGILLALSIGCLILLAVFATLGYCFGWCVFLFWPEIAKIEIGLSGTGATIHETLIHVGTAIFGVVLFTLILFSGFIKWIWANIKLAIETYEEEHHHESNVEHEGIHGINRNAKKRIS